MSMFHPKAIEFVFVVRCAAATIQASSWTRRGPVHECVLLAALGLSSSVNISSVLRLDLVAPFQVKHLWLSQHQAFRRYHKAGGRDRKDSFHDGSNQAKVRPTGNPTVSRGAPEPSGQGRHRHSSRQDWGRSDGLRERKSGQKRRWWERSVSPTEQHTGQDPALKQFAKGDGAGVENDSHRHGVKQPPKSLSDWLRSVRANFKELQSNQATPARVTGGAGALPGIPKSATAAEALAQLVPPRQGDGLRSLDWPPSACPGPNASPSSSPVRFDPRLLPDVVRVFQRASARLSFTTQLPNAVAAYVVAASQRGALDLASFDVSVCKALVLYLGQAHVVNRDFLEELRKALQSRWSQLRPDDLVELLGGLKRLNDADRLANVGRPGAGSSRLLRMMLDAEPHIMALLRQDEPASAPEPGRGAQDPNAPTVTFTGSGSSEGGSHGLGHGGGGLPAAAAVKLALAYLSFYMTATSGHQHFAIAPMLLATLEACLDRLDPGDARQVPADELGRLVAGMAGVALLPSHQLAGHLRRCTLAAAERFSEMSQPSRALLLDLPAQHWALPPGWRDRVAGTAALQLKRTGDVDAAITAAAVR